MDFIYQVWGGGFYLTNKILLAIAEGKPHNLSRWLKLIGWCIYILGVPAWVIILVAKQNWIAASIEAGGVPSMLLGLYSVYKNSRTTPRRLGLLAKSVTYLAIALGVGYSLYAHAGINSVTQLLEIGVMIGFLMGSYLLAMQRLSGWLFFIIMNGSMASLMSLQDKPILAIQQLVSLCFVLYGLAMAIRAGKPKGLAW